MKKLFLISLLLIFCVSIDYAQNTIKLRYPACEIKNEQVYSNTKGIKTFIISTQEEFDQYFIQADDTKINFETSIVLAAIVGSDKSDKFVQIDAASFISSKARSLYIRYDVRDSENELYKKFCVAVIHKPNYKKASFLKGKFYNMAISGE